MRGWLRALLLLTPLYVSAADLTLPDVNGKPIHVLAADKTEVYLFVRTDCPISSRYAPEITRLRQSFANAIFVLVFVDPAQPATEISNYLSEYHYQFPAVIDRKHALVKLAHASATPEAAVFVNGQLIYHGRIDDRYLAFDKVRATPTRRDLHDVLQAIAAGRTPPYRETKAIGCYIADLE